MSVYDGRLRVYDALQQYFAKYHFVNGGYDLKWFKIKIGPVFIPLPNIKARVDAVKLHDIHHLITEYPATLKGEAQIGAWEIAAGCGRYYASWILNAGGFFYGLFCFPRALFKAFMLGRRTHTSLYYNVEYNDQLLARSLEDLREYVGTDNKKQNVFRDYVYFILFALLVLSASVVFFYGLFSGIRFLLLLF